MRNSHSLNNLNSQLDNNLSKHHKGYLKNYLKNHAEKVTNALIKDISTSLVAPQFNHCLVIPAYNESHNFVESLITKLDDELWSRTIIILVINQPDTDDNTKINQALWSKLTELCFKKANIERLAADSNTNNFLTLDHFKSSSSIVALDFFSDARKLSSKKGVGLARKIGCDLACHFIHQAILCTDWLHTSDADTQLPDDYFYQTTVINSKRASAAIYDFMHIGENNRVTDSTQLYEKSLHYYVDGLRFANSIYAYHTLGSCIAINSMSYMIVRGFTKRAGGEDFYCLNKLAKVGEIKQLKGNKLHITARNSDRVPFGTGPAIKRILNNSESTTTLMVYNPIIFNLLKKLLLSFENLFNYRDMPNEWLDQQPEDIKITLQSLHINILFNHITSQIKDQQSSMSHIHHWFDGFKTLKFIHALEKKYPKMNLEKAKNQLEAGFK